MRAIIAMIALASAAMAPAAKPDSLASDLAGRTPGKPVECIWLHDAGQSIIPDRGTIEFRGATRAAPIYVNRPRGGCPELAEGRGIVTRTPSDMLCSGDIVQIVDFVSHIHYGSCALGAFTPYERQRKAP